MKNSAPSLDTDVVVMSPAKKATIEHADPTLYGRLDERYSGFKEHELISSYEFESSWTTWEMHPHGDEVVILLAGQATLVLRLATGEKSVLLDQQGQFVIVPTGTWNTAKVNQYARMLFITPGEGTLHEEV